VDPAERLFAEDTARGLKLVQMLSRRYDVVVMNPPYGGFVPTVKEFVKAAYPLTANDIYATFIDRATQLTAPEGYVGALVSATFVNLTTFEKLRTEILLKRNPLITMLDLGFGILDDATVEAAAVVLRGGVR
jgi:23S rRNA G2069 N7-methylase RlmK/C1962 C5-methylase RlmI